MGDFAILAAQPTEHQKQLWWEYIAIQEEPVLVGATLVWCGWCPLCDKKQSPDDFTARFDFRRGLLYCENGEDGRACFKQRSMSLNNVLVSMGQSG